MLSQTLHPNRSRSRFDLTLESDETFFARRRLIAAALPSPPPPGPPGPPAPPAAPGPPSLSRKNASSECTPLANRWSRARLLRAKRAATRGIGRERESAKGGGKQA